MLLFTTFLYIGRRCTWGWTRTRLHALNYYLIYLACYVMVYTNLWLQVYLGLDTRTGEHVAIKQLSLEKIPGESLQVRC